MFSCKEWYQWADSNRHSRRNQILNLACLPIPPHWLCKYLEVATTNLQVGRIIAIEALLASILLTIIRVCRLFNRQTLGLLNIVPKSVNYPTLHWGSDWDDLIAYGHLIRREWSPMKRLIHLHCNIFNKLTELTNINIEIAFVAWERFFITQSWMMVFQYERLVKKVQAC